MTKLILLSHCLHVPKMMIMRMISDQTMEGSYFHDQTNSIIELVTLSDDTKYSFRGQVSVVIATNLIKIHVRSA